MPSNEPLFFLARSSDYKQGKVNLLQAKSSLLVSRNHIQNLKELSKQKVAIKAQIKRDMGKLSMLIKNFEGELPEVKGSSRKKASSKPRKSVSPVPSVNNPEKVQIDSELNSIEAKLRELANL
jgi:hypothetical protein